MVFYYKKKIGVLLIKTRMIPICLSSIKKDECDEKKLTFLKKIKKTGLKNAEPAYIMIVRAEPIIQPDSDDCWLQRHRPSLF